MSSITTTSTVTIDGATVTSTTSLGALKLRYGAGPGRAEPTRLALAMGGIEWTEEPLADWQKYKAEEHHYRPKGQMPLLEVEGRGTFAQSHTMLRFAGKLSGIVPGDPFLAAQVDEALDYMVRRGCSPLC